MSQIWSTKSRRRIVTKIGRCERPESGEELGRRASSTRSRIEEGRQGKVAGGGSQGARESCGQVVHAGRDKGRQHSGIRTKKLRGMRLDASTARCPLLFLPSFISGISDIPQLEVLLASKKARVNAVMAEYMPSKKSTLQHRRRSALLKTSSRRPSGLLVLLRSRPVAEDTWGRFRAPARVH
jgi:hypothetical protein